MMSNPVLYNGLWPKNVSKTAKYAVRMDDGQWKVTVTIDFGGGMKALAVEGEYADLVELVNGIKLKLGQGNGGPFYINEYQHLIVPVHMNGTSHYYYGGKVNADFQFVFNGNVYTTKPVSNNGLKLNAGEEWTGPRPGIPYILSAGGTDIRYKVNVLTQENPPKIMPNIIKQVSLLSGCVNKSTAEENIRMIKKVKGTDGGRFYVNENRAVFTPLRADNGDGWNYVYCGELDMNGWFPEPVQMCYPID